MRMTFAEIYLKNFEHNINQIKNNLRSGVKMCAAVKADAYGHGAVQCAKTALKCGVEYLSVATVPEGIELRKIGIKSPILVLSLCAQKEMGDLVKYNLTPLVGDAEYIELVERAVKKSMEAASKNGIVSALFKKFTVHLAVDTGMGRIGCLPKDAQILAKKIAASVFLELGGICTHFASADETSETYRNYAQEQYENFTFAINSVREAKINPGIVHCSASAALLDHQDWQFDMVRPGIILYGYYAGAIDKKYLSQKNMEFNLKPVMAFVTAVSVIRPFNEGKAVSYGCTWKAQKDTDIAVLPVGYADGLLRRAASNKKSGLKVAINGKLYPVRGRICMDQCMVEIGKDNNNVKRFDRAVIFGPKESGALTTAQDLADAQGTISYEILTCVSKRVKRVFLR